MFILSVQHVLTAATHSCYRSLSRLLTGGSRERRKLTRDEAIRCTFTSPHIPRKPVVFIFRGAESWGGHRRFTVALALRSGEKVLCTQNSENLRGSSTLKKRYRARRKPPIFDTLTSFHRQRARSLRQV